MSQAEAGPILPTVGLNIEEVRHKNIRFMVWDMGGQDKIRPLWRFNQFTGGAKGIIFVVDSSDRMRVELAQKELHKMISNKNLCKVPILIMANKQDLPNAMDTNELSDNMRLDDITDHSWCIQPTCAIQQKGLLEGLDWMSAEMAMERN